MRLCRAAVVGAVVLAPSSGSATAQSQESIDLPYELHSSLVHASEAKILDWLREGGDPDTVLDGDGNTFMHYAATNLLHILQEAIRRGGDCNRKNAHGATPLHFAASQDLLGPGAEALRILVRCEASPNVRRACASGDRWTAEACRADPDAQDRRGATPLHTVYQGVEASVGVGTPPRNLGVSGPRDSGGGAREDVVRVLLEELGADPNIRNGNGDTPLMLPIRNINNPGVASSPGHVSFILKHGADPDARNNKGATPLIETVSLFSAARDDDDSPRVVRRLIEHGADPCLRDRAGRLAYDHAQADGALALYNAGGYPHPETGICIRDLLKAEEQEKKLGLARSVRRQLQSCLKTAGFDPGAPDGLFGPRTRAAVRAWQAAQGREGIEAAGYFARGETDALLEACRTGGPEPLCAGQTGSGCWMEVTNHSGCYIWNPNPQPEETVAWSGRCVDGKVSGMGRAVWEFREDGVSMLTWSEGNHLDGGKGSSGHWVLRQSAGDVWEGAMVGGERHGLWVERGSGGTVTSCQQNSERVDRSRCVAPADGKMQVVGHAGIRSGPGDDYEHLGALQAEARVTVTGEAGGWLSVETQDGRGGFARASALVEVAEPELAARVTEPRCYNQEYALLDEKENNYCWVEISYPPMCLIRVTFHDSDALQSVYRVVGGRDTKWSGECTEDLANGKGTLSINHSRNDAGIVDFTIAYEDHGMYSYGLRKGPWTLKLRSQAKAKSRNNIVEYERMGNYVDGMPNGNWKRRKYWHTSGTNSDGSAWKYSTTCTFTAMFEKGVIQSLSPPDRGCTSD